MKSILIADDAHPEQGVDLCREHGFGIEMQAFHSTSGSRSLAGVLGTSICTTITAPISSDSAWEKGAQESVLWLQTNGFFVPRQAV
jgi:hypothetical protein